MIYFLASIEPWADVVKIGFSSRHDGRRLGQIACGEPFKSAPLRPPLDGGMREERALHRRFAAYRLNGEWFKLSAIRDELLALEGVELDAAALGVCPRCGVPKKGPRAARGAMCRRCAAAWSTASAAVRRVLRDQARLVCQAVGCETPLGKNNTTGLCRPCGMRKVWASPEYRASIMPAREQRRRRCLHCGLSEPRLGDTAKYHPECWRAASGASYRIGSSNDEGRVAENPDRLGAREGDG